MQEEIMTVIRKASVLAAVLLGVCAGSARAQDRFVAKIPFAFVVAGKTLPAGQYEVRPMEASGAVVEIESLDTPSVHALVMSSAAGGFDPVGDQPALVFTRYENEYRLTQIWDSTTEGRDVPEPARTRHDAHGDRESALPAQQYVLAANWT
jgi:hypothetical protein